MAVALNSVLVPIDFSESGSKALDWAVELARPRQATIYLLHVVEPLAYPVEWLEGLSGFDTLEDVVLANAKKALDKVAQQVREQGLQVVTEVVFGYPSEAIVEYAREHQISMICIAAHRRSGLEKLLLGSTTEKVVRQAPCPVLVVRDSTAER